MRDHSLYLFDGRINVLLCFTINYVRSEHSFATFCGVILLPNQLRFLTCSTFDDYHYSCDGYYCDYKDGNQN